MNPDFGTTNAALIKDGAPRMSGKEIRHFISGKTLTGDYGAAFKFKTYFDASGLMEGKNNVGSHNRGEWSINDRKSTLSVEWDAGWVASTSYAYAIDGNVKFYIANTGQWSTTLYDSEDGRQNLVP